VIIALYKSTLYLTLPYLTCDVEAAQVLYDHFQESFAVEKQVDELTNNEIPTFET